MIIHAESRVITSTFRSGLVSVCPGETLNITCSTFRRFFEWNVTVFNQPGPTSRTRVVAPNIQFNPQIIVDNKTFLVSSVNGSTTESGRITSTLLIMHITADLNRTEVECTELENSRDDAISVISATVHVLRSEQGRFLFN